MPSPNANSLVRPRLPEVDTHGVHGPGLGADGRDWVGALSEVARVARHFVAMAEPFREWNADSLRRDRIVGKSYFQATLTDLHAHGLDIALVGDDIPSKLALGIGYVLARKAPASGASPTGRPNT